MATSVTDLDGLVCETVSVPPGPTRRRPSPRASRIGGIAVRGLAVSLLVFYGLLSVYPFLWMVSGAFKDVQEVTSSGSLLPQRPTLQTLIDTWSTLDFALFLRNSVVLTGISLILIVIVYSLAGYALSVMTFPGRRLVFAGFLAILFVPGVTTLLPLVLLFYELGLLNSWTGLALAFANGAAPLAILIFKSLYDSIPREIHEAARIDGASEFRIYWRLYLPLARPAIITVLVLNFVSIWNEYVLTAVVLSDPEKYSLPLGLQNLLSTNVVRWNDVMAGSLLLVVPVIFVFVLLQRYFVSSITGAVK